MRKLLIIAGTATLVAVLGVAAIGAVAFAQDADDGPLFDFRVRMKELIAEQLGVSIEKYDNAVDSAQGQVLEEAVEQGALTQEQADRMQERFEEGGRLGKMPHDFDGAEGFRGSKRGGMRGGSMNPVGAGPLEAAAEALDLTIEELQAELEAGKTIAELAEAKGVALDTIVAAYTAQMAEQLAGAVESGRMTQEQAGTMQEKMGEHIQSMLEGETPFRGAPGGRPGKFSPGGERPPFPGQNDA